MITLGLREAQLLSVQFFAQADSALIGWSLRTAPMTSTAGRAAIAFVLRYKRLLGVALFLAILFAIFEISGLRDHFNLAFIRQLILQHRVGGLVLFVLLFSLGNLIQIPGLVFLAAAVFSEVIAICVGSGKFYPWYVGMFFPMALLLEEEHWMRELALVLSLTELLHFTPLQRQPITTYLLSTAVPLVVVAWRARGSRRSAARFATEP